MSEIFLFMSSFSLNAKGIVNRFKKNKVIKKQYLVGTYYRYLFNRSSNHKNVGKFRKSTVTLKINLFVMIEKEKLFKI